MAAIPAALSLGTLNQVTIHGDEAMLETIEHFRERHRLTSIDPEHLDLVIDEISLTGLEPVNYISNLFSSHEIVFVGHNLPSRKTGLFLQQLIPAVNKAGVYLLGIEWACMDDQSLLDELVNADQFDEGIARSALFRWGLRYHFAFVEYLDILRAVWAINRTQASGSAPFRIVALDYDIDIEAVTDNADLLSPYAWEHLRPRGPASKHMADVLLTEFVRHGHKALVLTKTGNALTRMRRRPHPTMDQIDTQIVDGKVVGCGNYVYSAIADRAATVLLHQPLTADGEHGLFTLPADGYLDAAFAHTNNPHFPVAFDVSSGSIGRLPCATSIDNGDISQLCNGWIFLERPKDVRGPTPLRGLVDETNIAEARKWSLDPMLRQPNSTIRDFDIAIQNAAAAAELSWTQIV
ncbi:MAG: hypothetical protein MB55_02910 [marine actinobacterium MedAcidi-G3]|nr:MAG: hypothetical protein MB55_02910 [marine actinobacterium MedAcidi-G3]MBA4812563.1 hypothetical protein [Acidimicrobiales bacterium]RPH17666.1 MAG: hypothetical protein CBE30_003740 [Actinobacteria bacterium TMED270]